MRTKYALASLPFLAVLALPGAALAEPVRQVLPFSVTTNLTPNRTHEFRFSLFDTETAGTGTEVWRETASYRIPVSRVIKHDLGSVVPFSEGMHGVDPGLPAVPVNFTEQFWVEVSGGSFVRRIKLGAVPFAIATSGLRVEQKETSPNLLGGHPGNAAADGVHGATVAGGGRQDRLNHVTGAFGSIGGGDGNRAGEYGTVGGGLENEATGNEATVAGGATNIASGDGAVIVGGCSNKAAGYRAFAGGEDANASQRGMFVWSATDDWDPDGGFDNHYRRVFEYDGFPQTTDGTNPNALLKPMQFWVKSPGGVFFVTGRDDNGAPLGVMLPMGAQSWEPITPSPVLGALNNGAPETPRMAGDRPTLQEQVLDLERRSAVQQDQIAASRTENAALRERLEDLLLRFAELRRLVGGEPRGAGDLAALGDGDPSRP